jgi:hypothetical protein
VTSVRDAAGCTELPLDKSPGRAATNPYKVGHVALRYGLAGSAVSWPTHTSFIFGILRRPLFGKERRSEIASPVDRPQNLNDLAGDPIENDIRVNWHRSQLERHIEVFANSTLRGRDAKECAAIEDAVDHRGRAVGAVRGDIVSNQLEIAPGTTGEPDSRQLDLGDRGVLIVKLSDHVLEVDQVAAVGVGGTL